MRSSTTTQLKNAREARGLTQRALAERVGIPQSHLSRIEQGRVDLQLSTLQQLARALDLEWVLVPRQSLPPIDALTNRTVDPNPEGSSERRQLELLHSKACMLSKRFPGIPILKRLVHTLTALRSLPLTSSAPATELIATIRRLFAVIGARPTKPTPRVITELDHAEQQLRKVRDALAHGGDAANVRRVPAYTLDDGAGVDDE
jgi:transcriptional regulator with XRE-family HTH domain